MISLHFFLSPKNAREKVRSFSLSLPCSFCMSGSRGVPGSSTSPGSDEGTQNTHLEMCALKVFFFLHPLSPQQSKKLSLSPSLPRYFTREPAPAQTSRQGGCAAPGAAPARQLAASLSSPKSKSKSKAEHPLRPSCFIGAPSCSSSSILLLPPLSRHPPGAPAPSLTAGGGGGQESRERADHGRREGGDLTACGRWSDPVLSSVLLPASAKARPAGAGATL